MKTTPYFLVVVLAAGSVCGAAPAPTVAVPVPAKPDSDALFALVGKDYKKPQEVPDSFFNPFKVETAPEFSAAKKNGVPTVSNDMVAEAVGRLGVSGIVYSAGTGVGRVIIGDQVFRIGDELDFPDAAGAMMPLIPHANVTLREVDVNTLVFDFTSESEPPRRASYPLKTFWRP